MAFTRNMKSIDDCLDLLEKDIGLFNDDPGSFSRKIIFDSLDPRD